MLEMIINIRFMFGFVSGSLITIIVGIIIYLIRKWIEKNIYYQGDL